MSTKTENCEHWELDVNNTCIECDIYVIDDDAYYELNDVGNKVKVGVWREAETPEDLADPLCDDGHVPALLWPTPEYRY